MTKTPRQTSDKVSTIASKILRGEKVSPAQVKSVAASALGQDQKPRPKK